MVRTLSGLGIDNENCQSEPHVIECAPEAASIVEPVTMVMIKSFLVVQKEEMRQFIQENRREPSVLVVQPELNEGKSEERNYSGTMSQVEPQVIRRNDTNEGADRNECKYKDFINFKPSSFTRK